MNNHGFHLCQVNIGLAKAPMDDPIMHGFASQLDRINQLADNSPGFVWRLQSDSGNATDILLYENPLMLYNMSVWESIDALFEYTYHSDHTAVMVHRKQWFNPMSGPYMALWWIPAGQLPAMPEGKARIDYLTAHGPSPVAFHFKNVFPPNPDAVLPLVMTDP